MKVMIVCPYFGPPWNEGVRNLVRVLDAQLRARGIETVVFATDAPGRHAGKAPRRIAALPEKVAAWKRAAAAARRGGVDVIHMMSSVTTLAGLKSRTLRRGSGVPVVGHFTGVGRPHLGYSWLMDVDRVLVGGEYLRRFFTAATNVPPLTPHMSAAPPREPAETPRSSGKVLYLGAMERVRGVHTLIGALRVLKDELGVGDFTLTIAWNGYGEPGYVESIREQIAAGGLEAHVRWDRTEADVPSLYAGHDLLVVPRAGGTRMAFPLRVIEAMSYGKPVVTSDAGELPAIVEGCGVVYAREDERSLAGAIHSLLTDPELYARCARGAAERAGEFATSRTVDRIVSVYRELLDVQ